MVKWKFGKNEEEAQKQRVLKKKGYFLKVNNSTSQDCLQNDIEGNLSKKRDGSV